MKKIVFCILVAAFLAASINWLIGTYISTTLSIIVGFPMGALAGVVGAKIGFRWAGF